MHHFLKRKMSHGSKAKKLSEWSSSWWLNPPSEKYAQAKLENLSLIFGLWKCKKYLRFHHLDFRMIPNSTRNQWLFSRDKPNVWGSSPVTLLDTHLKNMCQIWIISQIAPPCDSSRDLLIPKRWRSPPSQKGHENAEFSRHLIQLLSISHIFQLTQSASRTKFDFWIKGI